MKIGDPVKGIVPPFKDKIGKIKNIDGYYIDVMFQGTEHIVELYPNEIELLNPSGE